MSAPRRSRAGFTLLELLVAIALLGVLAVLCWRGLESVLSSRDRLTRESEGLRALTIAFAQVDDDLRRTWAVRTIPAVARAVRFLSVDDRLVLELARLGGTASDPTRIDRVVWRLRADTLERGVAANIADGANAAGELVWQPVLAGVKDLQWRAWPSGQGWQTGFSMAALMASQDASP
ncbi:MAG: prepilin-type N-terminal cleavage/methylation domain-containing protein, partial [Betaproteobacteria bacterium]|nr:prepilin-type N-terminal cleavage/methylation domain-containing protein [Betaproteobacteria bacterium]